MVNKTIVLRLLGNIEGYLNDLKLLNEISFSDFKIDIEIVYEIATKNAMTLKPFWII